LRSETFDYAVSSDLSRAFETARAIRRGAPLERDARWREFAFGEWEGLTWEQIVERHPELAEYGSAAAKQYVPPGGESFEAVTRRVGEALEHYRAARYEHVLIVTHAGPLHAMLHTFFGRREAQMQEVLGIRFSPAGITRLAVDEKGAELLVLNDVGHLPAL
jgi:probable phosphoglycerate mutase